MNRLRDQVKDRPDSSCSLPQENRHTNIVIRNMVQRENENVERRVNGLIQDSLRLRDISVAKAVRKQSRSDSKPGLIIATMKSNEDKETVMKHKRHLKNSSRYEHVYIENDIPASQRAVNSNFRTPINALGRDTFQLKGSRISVREETSETGNSQRYDYNDSRESYDNWHYNRRTEWSNGDRSSERRDTRSDYSRERRYNGERRDTRNYHYNY